MRVTGTAKWFSSEKGFGFTNPFHGGADAFVHRSSIAGTGHRKTLIGGATVEYVVVYGDKGAQARNVAQIRS